MTFLIFILALGLVSVGPIDAWASFGLTRCGNYRATGELLFDKKKPILRIHGFSQKEVILYMRGSVLEDPTRLFGQMIIVTGQVHNIRDRTHGDMEVSVIERLPVVPQMIKNRDSVDSLTLLKAEKCGRKPK